jgi:hypothetical protein
VKDAILTGFQHERSDTTRIRHALPLELCAVLYARMALGAAFLSAVADRFGLWGKYGGWGNFANFEHPRQRFLLSLCQSRRDQMRKMDAGDENDKSRQPHASRVETDLESLNLGKCTTITKLRVGGSSAGPPGCTTQDGTLYEHFRHKPWKSMKEHFKNVSMREFYAVHLYGGGRKIGPKRELFLALADEAESLRFRRILNESTLRSARVGRSRGPQTARPHAATRRGRSSV